MPGFRNRPATGRICHRIELSSLTKRRRPSSTGGRTPALEDAPPAPGQTAHQALDEGAMRLQLERMVAEHVADLPAAGQGVDAAELELLQRRLRKVTDALVGREAEVESLKRALAADPGLASVYQEVQGVLPDAADAKQRTSLMKQIFTANLKLKESLTLNRPSAE